MTPARKDGQEQARRRDDALRRALAMPPKRHAFADGGLEEVRRRFSVVREQAAALGRQLSSEEDRGAGS